MGFSVARLVEDISNDMLRARSFEARWNIITTVLDGLGAQAVNATAINAKTGVPVWFRSTLGQKILSAYVAEGHHENDLLVHHAARHQTPLVWNTKNGSFTNVTAPQRAFADFVVDSGYLALVTQSMIGRSENDIRTLTFCSTEKPGEILDPAHLHKVRLAMNILLPWLGWPEHQNHPEFVRLRHQRLSRREVEALSFLACGHLNARIAEAMGITEVTVAKHLRTARQKLGARTREQAIAIAIRDGHLSP